MHTEVDRSDALLSEVAQGTTQENLTVRIRGSETSIGYSDRVLARWRTPASLGVESGSLVYLAVVLPSHYRVSIEELIANQGIGKVITMQTRRLRLVPGPRRIFQDISETAFWSVYLRLFTSWTFHFFLYVMLSWAIWHLSPTSFDKPVLPKKHQSGLS